MPFLIFKIFAQLETNTVDKKSELTYLDHTNHEVNSLIFTYCTVQQVLIVPLLERCYFLEKIIHFRLFPFLI